jgi:hypothetical protein
LPRGFFANPTLRLADPHRKVVLCALAQTRLPSRAEAGNLCARDWNGRHAEQVQSEYVDETLLALEASGEAAKIFDKWFAPSPRLFKFRRD